MNFFKNKIQGTLKFFIVSFSTKVNKNNNSQDAKTLNLIENFKRKTVNDIIYKENLCIYLLMNANLVIIVLKRRKIRNVEVSVKDIIN